MRAGPARQASGRLIDSPPRRRFLQETFPNARARWRWVARRLRSRIARCMVSDPVSLGDMPRALVLGGTGQVGVAVARRLLNAGWDVDLTGRHHPNLEVEGARFIRSDRSDPSDLRTAFGAGADLL